MSKYNIHKDFAFLRFVPYTKKWMISPMNKLVKWQYNRMKVPESIELSINKIKGYNKAEITVDVFKPKNIANNAPCLFYVHGGGFFFEALNAHKNVMCEYAEKAGCIVVFPHYNVSLKGAFPMALEDCYAALAWVKSNLNALGIDENRFGIGGDSAGGCLAACVVQKNMDTSLIDVCFQMLIYPVCDHKMITESMKQFTDVPLWNTASTKMMWDIYLKGLDRNNLPNYVSPLQRTNLKGLPTTYLEVADFDCLRDEGILYANTLKEASVLVEFNQTKGTIHGYDAIRKSEVTEDNINQRIRFLRRLFSKTEKLSSH